MMCPGVFQRMKEKTALRLQISKYLETIHNQKDYEDAKNILNAYYFDSDKFETIKELNKEAGTYDLIQYRLDSFKDFVKQNSLSNNLEEEEEKCL